MPTTSPADQDQRDLVRDALDETLFVEAGAGTGKTTSLVARIVRLVTTGTAELREIAAITFTEAAAAELRDRIRQQLERTRDDALLPGDERARCAVALQQIDAAAIQTLHGFAQRLLMSAPLEAGLPPRIEILDAVRSHIAFEERWQLALDTLLVTDGPVASAMLRAFLLGMKDDYLYEVAREFHDHWDRLEGVQFDAAAAVIDLDAVVEPLEEAVASISQCHSPDPLLRRLQDIEAYLARLENAERKGPIDLIRVLGEHTKLTESRGNQGNWSGVRPADIRALLKQASEARDALCAALRGEVLAPILTTLRAWTLEYAEDRRRAGTLEFHDLLVLARNLLRENPAVRAAMANRYRRILVDEFQDTDPIQLEIVTLLAIPPAADASDWRNAAVEPGKLFFVGDPKQAIFRFRGADVAVYEAARRQLSARPVYLTHNFRSVPPVIDWVNGVFEQVIGAGAGDGQPAYRPLSAHRDATGDGPAVRVLGGPQEVKAVKALRDDLESPEIAATIAAIRDQAWPVQAEDGQLRGAALKDITVVVPTRTTLESLERALDRAGVPYRVESRSLIYASQEIRDLTNILAAIDDPTNEVMLVAALRSLAFACSDRDLLAWRRAGGRWDYRRPRPDAVPADHPVALAMAALHTYHEERWWQPVNVLVERLIRERRMFELALANRRARDHWQRLRLVLDQARRFADEGGVSLRGFVRWLLRQAEEDVAVVESVVPQADDDAIRITTIHAAKGLEYPVVVMAGLNAGRANTHSKVLWPAGGSPEVQCGGFATPGYAALLEAESQMDGYERARLLYVGATRARDHLVLSLHHKSASVSPAQTLYQACGWLPDTWAPLQPAEVIAPPPSLGAVLTGEDATIARDAWREHRDAVLSAASRPAALAATAIAHEPSAEPADETAFWQKGRGSSAVGRAVHAVLQAADLATGEGIDALAGAQAAGEGIPSQAGQVATLARAALRAPAIREAVASGRYWREVYVAAPVDGVVLEGFIDLLYETPDGFVVVDYKTDTLAGDAALEAALARYRLQGATYALALDALREQLGRPVVRCVFVFVRGDEPREAVVENLPAAMEDVRARVAAR